MCAADLQALFLAASTLLLAALILLLGPAHASSSALDTTTDVYIICNTHTYANGSAFSEELGTALHALQHNASSAPYSSAQAGTAIAAYQCRGDLPLDSCSQCVQAAVQTALSRCPNAIGSRVQLDGCFLRYENYSFFVEESSVVAELCDTHESNSSSFQRHVAELLSRVLANAPSNKLMYATATSAIAFSSTNVPANQLYALAQCLDYLSPAACSRCLAAHSYSWQDCGHAVGAQIHFVSCYYRFDIIPFFYTA